ncbi:MAG: fumarylacetoacetate hydrolase family protein [Pseudomonadota bacterium]
MQRLTGLIASLMVCGGAALADCADDAEVAAFVDAFAAKQPAQALGVEGSMDDALCTQAKVAAAMEPVMGPVAGYKAGLTSKPAQERFGVTEPVRGVLYRDGLLENGASVPEAYGAVPVFEADLLLVIGDPAINSAHTTEEAMAHISAIHPFIELPDLTLAKGQPINGVTLTAMGVGPRMGVMGDAVPVSDPAAMHMALQSMEVVLSAADGEELARVPGAAVLGHPVQSALWLVSKGVTFKEGDLVSVGSFGPLFPPAKGKGGATARYIGLPGDPSVSVTFTQ